MKLFTNNLIRKLIPILLIIAMIMIDLGSGTISKAAESSPSLVENEVTLYTGYKAHAIKCKNLSKDAKITYTSSNTKVAKVSKKGIVTPLKKGKIKITVSINQNKNKYKLKLSVNVLNPYVEITDFTDIISVNGQYRFKAKAVGMNAGIKWSVSDTSLAKIDEMGLFDSLRPGIVVVKAEAGKYSATYQVNIGTDRINTIYKNVYCKSKSILEISIKDYIDKEELIITTKGEGVISYELGKRDSNKNFKLSIIPIKKGNETLIIRSSKTSDYLIIFITVSEDLDVYPMSQDYIYNHYKDTVVSIQSDSLYYGKSNGTGFFIDKGKIATSFQVIEGAKEISITTIDKKVYKVNRILGYNEKLDVAILEVDIPDNKYVTLAKSDYISLDELYAFGNPTTYKYSNLKIYTVNNINTNFELPNEGMGGPVFSQYGEVVGLTTRLTSGNVYIINQVSNLKSLELDSPLYVSSFSDIYWSKYKKTAENGYDSEDYKAGYAHSYTQIFESSLIQGNILCEGEKDVYTINIKDGQSRKIRVMLTTDTPELIHHLSLGVTRNPKEKPLHYIRSSFMPLGLARKFFENTSTESFHIVVSGPERYLIQKVKYNLVIKYD